MRRLDENARLAPHVPSLASPTNAHDASNDLPRRTKLGVAREDAQRRRALPPRATAHLNLLRGVSAVLVLAYHLRALLFVNYGSLPRPSIALKALYYATGFGHQAVVVFFVLSGFFIGTSVLGSFSADRWSWTDYVVRRVSRLQVVLVPALLLTAIWDYLGIYLVGFAHSIYAADTERPEVLVKPIDLSVKTFLGNMVHLQSFACTFFGSNSPLWSLSIEFWSYLVFPLVVGAAYWRRAHVRQATVCAVAALVLLTAGGFVSLRYFPLWLAGAGVAALRLRVDRTPGNRAAFTMLLASCGVFALTISAARFDSFHNEWVADVLLSIATAWLVWSIVAPAVGSSIATTRFGAYSRATEWLASFSYTLYLVHFPVIVFLHAWLLRGTRWEPTGVHILDACAIALGIMLLYVLPLSRVTEARTDDVRRWLIRWIPQQFRHF